MCYDVLLVHALLPHSHLASLLLSPSCSFFWFARPPFIKHHLASLAIEGILCNEVVRHMVECCEHQLVELCQGEME